MQDFRDNKNRTWDIVLNVSQIKRLRDKLKLDLLADDNGLSFSQLYTDPILLCNVLFVLCEKQAEERSVSDEDFGESLAGESIAKATEAFLTELADFFPNKKQSALLKSAVQKMDSLQDRMLDKMEAEMEKEMEETAKQTGLL